MKKLTRREQHYAVSNEGILAHIKDAHKNSEEYYCPQCSCKMLKRCGNIRAWHFAHDWRFANEYQKKCSYETYLHGYAKLRLKQWFDESNSIILQYLQSTVCKLYDVCKLKNHEACRRNCYRSCDLKRVFNKCSVESWVKESNKNYRADLLLTSEIDPYRQILIEIKVSHGCTKEKIESGAHIIEFEIASEEDVDYIISHDINESDKVRYYGFRKEKYDDSRLISPVHSLYKFILYKSKKTFCKKIDCQSIADRHHSSLFEITAKISKEDCWRLNMYGLMMATENGFQIPNCYTCEHHCYKSGEECHMCKIKDTVIEKGSDALKCQSYKFIPDVFDTVKSVPLEVFDVWNKSPHIGN